MHFVLLASHTPDSCPTCNSKTRDLLLKTVPQIPSIAEKNGVTFVAGPFVNREHIVVVVAQADKAENVDSFLRETRLGHWNSVHILPCLTLEEGLKEVESQAPIF